MEQHVLNRPNPSDAVWPSKRNAVFFLANQSFKVYFHVSTVSCSRTIIQLTLYHLSRQRCAA